MVLAGPATGSAAVPTFRGLVSTDLPAGTGTAHFGLLHGGWRRLDSFAEHAGNGIGHVLTPSLIAQTANTVLAGPTSGGNTAPTFRRSG